MGQKHSKPSKPSSKLTKRNRNASTTGLVRSTTRSTRQASTPTSPNFPPSIYESSPFDSLRSTASFAGPLYTSPTASPTTPSPRFPIGSTPPHQINRLSDIVDPRDLLPIPSSPSPLIRNNNSRHVSLGNQTLVHSPSGTLMGASEFLSHPDRPLAMWERQQRIASATLQQVEGIEKEERAATRQTLRKEEKNLRKTRSCWRGLRWL